MDKQRLNLWQLVSSYEWIILLYQATTFSSVVNTATVCLSVTMQVAKVPTTPKTNTEKN